MKSSNTAFIIHFVGLKVGKYEYEFELNRSFFEAIEHSLIEDGQLKAKLLLEKKETMLIGNYSIEGDVTVTCDRCNDELHLPINGAFRIVYKFGTGVSDDENLIVMHPDAYELDVSQQLYELACISLPSVRKHPLDECNQEVLKYYQSTIVNPSFEDEDDEPDEDDWDEEDWDPENEDGDEEEEGDDTNDDPDRPIDPRWDILKQLN